MASVFGHPINVPHWKENDPLTLVRKDKAGVGKLAIYFNCGREDEYGFAVGATALDRLLNGEHIKHEFHLYPGSHDASYFGTHLGEVIEFHSKLFETEK